jgi:hypothetical protein
MDTDVSEENAVSTCMLLVSYCCLISVRGKVNEVCRGLRYEQKYVSIDAKGRNSTFYPVDFGVKVAGLLT